MTTITINFWEIGYHLTAFAIFAFVWWKNEKGATWHYWMVLLMLVLHDAMEAML